MVGLVISSKLTFSCVRSYKESMVLKTETYNMRPIHFFKVKIYCFSLYGAVFEYFSEEDFKNNTYGSGET